MARFARAFDDLAETALAVDRPSPPARAANDNALLATRRLPRTVIYDVLGRVTRRAEVGLNSTWTYDTATNGIGSHAEAAANDGYSRVLTYDPLNRLSTWSIAGGAYQTIGYDALGDIKTKPGVGTYHYPAAGEPQPHAVSSITGTVRGVVNPKFTYDGDGNQLSGPGVAVGYTAWDMPAWVSSEQGGTTWGSFDWGSGQWNFTGETFAYDSEHQRVEMTAPVGSTFYFNDPASGGTSEYYVPTTGAAQWRDYIVADGRMVAERVATVGGSSALQYFVGDHLGSIAVVTDASGNVVQRMVYDPWGVQLASDGSQLCGAGPTTRGYTGEEQLPTGCLVNLNARVYDPVLGRFMSGDPVTGNVFDAQSLNRYGYVLNNPLSMTDTNGQCPICVLFVYAALSIIGGIEEARLLSPLLHHAPILGDLIVIADGIVCGPVLGPLCAAKAAGSIAGVESGSVGKGLKAFVLSFAEAEAFNFVGGQLQASHLTGSSFTASAAVAHGFVGGTFSVLQGGSFGSGFLAAGVSELATPYIAKSSQGNPGLGAVESAIVGGTASVLGGGKFGNGAVTGAFGYLFNDAAHRGARPNQGYVAPPAAPTIAGVADAIVAGAEWTFSTAASALSAVVLPLFLSGDTAQPQYQYIVRGGLCTPDRFCSGTGV